MYAPVLRSLVIEGRSGRVVQLCTSAQEFVSLFKNGSNVSMLIDLDK